LRRLCVTPKLKRCSFWTALPFHAELQGKGVEEVEEVELVDVVEEGFIRG
jgi:hypothetical protein